MHTVPQGAAGEFTPQAAALRFRVNVLGAVALAAYGSMSLLSFAQAPALWRGHAGAPRAIAFFDALANHLSIVALSHRFDGNVAVIVSYFVPLAVATVAAVLLVAMLHRCRRALDASIVRLLLRWSFTFAAVSLFAVPIFTQDFWLSAVWGRMVAAGLNPYHQLFTSDMMAGLPLDHFPMLMSYGPAWAILSAAVMAIAGNSALATAILFKAILGAAWIGAVLLVEKITEPRPVLERCLAIAVIGWMPLGLLQTVAEGHNDIVMAVLALLWLWLLMRGRWSAPVALVVSAMAKYVTAPLFIVDVIVTLRMHRLTWRALVLRSIVPGLLGVALLALFFRSLQFFEGTRVISEWHFLQPRHILGAFEDFVPFSLLPLELAIAAAFATITAYYLVALYKEPTPEAVAKAALAVMSAISFAGVAHLWPWYLVWSIGLAALVPTWWLSRFVIGVAILAPFTLAFWWIDALLNSKEWAALAMYAGALLWVAATRVAPSAADDQRSPQDRSPGDHSPGDLAGKSFGHP
jgi:alpha-1,6-mannosyltransferase